MRTMKFTLLGVIIGCAIISACTKKSQVATPADVTASITVSKLKTESTGRSIYVSATSIGLDDSTVTGQGLSATKPFKTITYASTYSKPGDFVYIMAGATYTRPGSAGAVVKITKSGTASSVITFKAYGSDHPVISGAGDIFQCVAITANYIVFDGIELIGNNANLNVSGGQAAEAEVRANKNAPQIDYAKYNTGGIAIGDKTLSIHHITISNCKVHDFPGGGIGAEHCDWITITNNQCYNNCLYTMYGSSGISTKDSFNFDSDITSNKFLINNNTCHDNQTLVTYLYATTEGIYSDGNGIIIDVNNGSINADGTINYSNPYNGKTRLENNISYSNGGGGVHVVEAHNIYVVNCTTYNNGLRNNGGATVGYAEMDSYGAYDVNYYSNIMYASSRTGATINGYTKPKSANGTITATGNIVYDYNVMYKGTIVVANTHFRSTDPLFMSLTTPNFRLSSSSSPAANFGLGSTPHYSYTDIIGVSRPQGTYPDCGAYESF